MEDERDPVSLDRDRGRSFPLLQTDRLILRRLEPADQEFLVSLDTDAQVMQFIHSGPLTKDEAQKFASAQIDLARFSYHLGKWVLELKRDGTSLGWVQVTKYRQARKREDGGDDVQIAYELAPEYWGVGYATEACRAVLHYVFGKLQLDRIVAFIRQENRRSQRILDKLGFAQDGTCRDDARNQCLFFVLTRIRWQLRTESPTKSEHGNYAVDDKAKFNLKQ